MSNIAVLVISCDSYSDTWPIFFQCFEKHWGNCAYKKYIVTNTLDADSVAFETIKTGPEIGWSDKVRKALKHIKEEYILVLLDDYFLSKNIDNVLFDDLFLDAIEMNIHYLCLSPYRYKIKINSKFSTIKNKNMYGKKLQAAFWDKKYFEQCLYSDTFSAWEFESRQKNDSPCKIVGNDCCLNKNKFFVYENGILQGKWYGPAIKKIARDGITFNNTSRPFLSRKEIFKRRLLNVIVRIMPHPLLKSLKRLLKKMGVKFITKD